MNNTNASELVTLQNLKEFGEDLKIELRGEMAELKSDLKAEISEVRTEMTEFRTEMASMETGIRSDMNKVNEELTMAINGIGILFENMQGDLKMALEWMYPKKVRS